jgi:hypothetical protein
MISINSMGNIIKVTPEYILAESQWVQDFRIINFQDASEMGVTYSGTKQVWITLHRHESIKSIIETILHETIHQAIADDVVGVDESENHDTEQEHEMMKRVIWVFNDWVDL